MQLSGKYENVRNLWTTSGRDVSNGDTLGFTLVCIDPTEQTTLRMQLSGNAVTHQQMTFDFSLFNNLDQRVKIWMLAPDFGDAAESDARSCNAVRIWRQMLTTLHTYSI